MAHKTLINGTSYEVSGGKALVDGTAYSIAGGRTLVGGTGYDISFVKPIPVTITDTTSTGNAYRYVTINGTKYTTSATGIEVVRGDTIVCFVAGVNAAGTVHVNKTEVFSSGVDTSGTYDWVVPTGITSIDISLTFISNNIMGPVIQGRIDITTS